MFTSYQICGFIIAKPYPFELSQHVARLGIGLHPSYRSAQLGTRMMRYAEEWLREAGYQQIKSEIIASNTRARRLGKNIGFIEEGCLKDIILLASGTCDLILVAKSLITAE